MVLTRSHAAPGHYLTDSVATLLYFPTPSWNRTPNHTAARLRLVITQAHERTASLIWFRTVAPAPYTATGMRNRFVVHLPSGITCNSSIFLPCSCSDLPSCTRCIPCLVTVTFYYPILLLLGFLLFVCNQHTFTTRRCVQTLLPYWVCTPLTSYSWNPFWFTTDV